MKIIQQNGYLLTWDDGGSYRVDSVDGTEMPLVTFDLHLAIECFADWAKKKTAPVGAGNGIRVNNFHS